jgi:hypothetical protein
MIISLNIAWIMWEKVVRGADSAYELVDDFPKSQRLLTTVNTAQLIALKRM